MQLITSVELKMTSLYEYFFMMWGAYNAMPQVEWDQLHAWEIENLDGHSVGTSDWTGWEKYIGKPPIPNRENREKNRRGFVYLVHAATGEYKIGHSKDVNLRLQAFKIQPPFDFNLVHTIAADDRFAAEKQIHEKFAEKRLKGEWFQLDDDDVAFLCNVSRFEHGEFFLNTRPQEARKAD